jgi:NhaP-type Na+/H+ or K+/H+ antiporter
MAFGINHMALGDAERLWGIVGLVVLMSILLHGLTVTPIMRSLDQQRGVDPEAKGVAPPGLQGPAGRSE